MELAQHGYTGLLTGKKAAVIYTGAVWGADRGPEFGVDHQQPFFEDWLRWAGVEDITSMRFQPNVATADADTARQRSYAQACDAGKDVLATPPQPARGAESWRDTRRGYRIGRRPHRRGNNVVRGATHEHSDLHGDRNDL